MLLVEDNAINQRVARRFLERLGCEVQVVGDGRQAVEAYERNSFDVILMDMQMPVMDGLEATRRIRELESGGPKRTPIVALTANAMMGTLERCLEAGMDDYLERRWRPAGAGRSGSVAGSRGGGPSGPGAAQSTTNGAERRQRDPRAARDVSGDDEEFMIELVNAFLSGGEDTVQELRAASSGDAERLAARHTSSRALRQSARQQSRDAVVRSGDARQVGSEGRLARGLREDRGGVRARGASNAHHGDKSKA